MQSISKFPRRHILYLILTSMPSQEVNREGIIILLSCTRKLRYLRVKGHDWGCTLAGGGVKTLTWNFGFFPRHHIRSFSINSHSLVPFQICVIFLCQSQVGDSMLNAWSLLLLILMERHHLPWLEIPTGAVISEMPHVYLSLLTFPSSHPEDTLNQMTFKPPLGAWSKMGCKHYFVSFLLK